MGKLVAFIMLLVLIGTPLATLYFLSAHTQLKFAPEPKDIGVSTWIAVRVANPHGERELDGLAIFKRGKVELERAASVGVILGEHGFALELSGIEVERVNDVGGSIIGRINALVTVAEFAMPAATLLAAKGDALATSCAGENVTAIFGGHMSSSDK